jgi:hypothetical protein
VESDVRFFRRRASEEMAAAARAVTEAARERRMMLARSFLERVKELESFGVESGRELVAVRAARTLEDA